VQVYRPANSAAAGKRSSQLEAKAFNVRAISGSTRRKISIRSRNVRSPTKGDVSRRWLPAAVSAVMAAISVSRGPVSNRAHSACQAGLWSGVNSLDQR